mmetsp:Transcript_35257/g.67398  ORF Transcript_35257/g.67398 Transcript_35257/m.67398 type:complete len:200 (-) Transcript_35257:941-1540(-)
MESAVGEAIGGLSGSLVGKVLRRKSGELEGELVGGMSGVLVGKVAARAVVGLAVSTLAGGVCVLRLCVEFVEVVNVVGLALGATAGMIGCGAVGEVVNRGDGSEGGGLAEVGRVVGILEVGDAVGTGVGTAVGTAVGGTVEGEVEDSDVVGSEVVGESDTCSDSGGAIGASTAVFVCTALRRVTIACVPAKHFTGAEVT